MKAPLLVAAIACLALAAAPLRAQEPSATPAPSPAADTRSQSEQILQNPAVQQLLRAVVQKALENLPASAGGAEGAKGSDLTAASTLLSNLTDDVTGGVPALPNPESSPGTPAARRTGLAAYVEARLASEPGERRFDAVSRTWQTRPWNEAERARRLAGFQQDYARLSAADRAAWEAGDGAVATMAHAWDNSLGSAHVQPGGGLQTGTLQTGTLTTGTLTTGRIQSGTTGTSLPPRDFVTPAAPRAAAAIPPPPVDPDAALRQWSQGIDGQYATELEARGAAVRAYPDLAVADSAFNAQFRARYAQYRQADPFGFLRGPGWPMKLAIFTEGDLKRQGGGTAAAP